jgi:hypothetical protein
MEIIDGRTQGIDKNNNVKICKYVAAFFFVFNFFIPVFMCVLNLLLFKKPHITRGNHFLLYSHFQNVSENRIKYSLIPGVII